jgi:poly(glycerol-phosphate) alpha-glucosyltransferase
MPVFWDSKFMRVAELTTYTSRLNDGVFFVLTALLPRLQRMQNAELKVFGYSDPRTEEDRALWGEVKVSAFSPWPPRVFGYSPRFQPALAAFAPDLIHSHGLWTYLSAASLRTHRNHGVPMVVSPHGMLDPWALALSAAKKRLVARLFQDEQLRRATVVHALNSSESRAIRAYGLSGPIVVIPNGVEVDPPRPSVPAPWANHIIAGRSKFLLFMARLHPKKGLKELFAAWRDVQAQKGPARDWGLVIAGWDEAGIQADLRHFAEAEGIADSVCFCGPLLGAQKAAALAQSHGFVLPSFSEGLPMSVLEAWSYGLPAIITPACNLSEGVDRGAALGCEPRPASIAAAILELTRLGDSERGKMGLAAQHLVCERFDWNTIAANLWRVYQSVARREPLPAELLAE